MAADIEYTMQDNEHQRSVNGASIIFGIASWLIRQPVSCGQSWRNCWPPLSEKPIAIPSLPHFENKRQWSVNDCWCCILGNLGGNRLQTVINEVLAVFIVKWDSDMLPAPASKWASTERHWLLALHHGQSLHDVVIIIYIYHFDCFSKSKGSRTLGGCSVNEIHCYCPRGCGGNIQYIFAHKGCHNLVYGCLWSSATHITNDARAKVIDAPLTLISKMGSGVFLFLFLLWRWPIQCLWLCATGRPADYLRHKTNNRWHSDDAHLQDVVCGVSIVLLTIKVANSSKTNSTIPMSIFSEEQ